MVAHKKKIHLLHERGSETYKCRECHKVFATAISLNTHYRSHSMHQTPIAPIATQPIGMERMSIHTSCLIHTPFVLPQVDLHLWVLVSELE